jgi:universal stress protein A
MIKRILVPVDFSTPSLRALDYAVDFGKRLHADLVVVHVVEPIYFAGPADLSGAAYDLGLVLQELERVGREQLARLEAKLARRRVRVSTVLHVGTAPAMIIETARAVKADLIVMSTHGRTGLAHMLMGSVAEKVVRIAECPVLTVRAVESTRRRKRGRRPLARRA